MPEHATRITHTSWRDAREGRPKVAHLEAETALPVRREDIWAYHSRPGAFERLSPPWQKVEVIERSGGIAEGDTLTMRVYQGPIGVRWVARHGPATPPGSFSDRQERGPFAFWHHRHLFEECPEGGATLRDSVEWRLPLGRLAHLVLGWKFRRDFERMFLYRHRVTALDLRRQSPGAKPMRIAISGASGLVGTALSSFLATAGHTVLHLVRRPARGEGEISWDPDAGTVDRAALEGVDAVVHLAGENVGGGRWTDARRKAILDSRVKGTRALAEAIASLESKPSVFISASASGFYGNQPDHADVPALDETAPPGEGFLAEVCQAWEDAAEPARQAGVRVVHPRIGVVLDPRGGALQKLLTPFKLGAGGRVGSGRQWMSWIALEDLVGLLAHALTETAIHGPLNAVAPEPVPQRVFAKTLGKVLGRPSILPLPAFVVKGLFGEMGESLLLGGVRVRPKAAEDHGFTFAFPELEGALRHVLGRV